MHVKADLLNCICNVRAGEGEILKSTCDTPEVSGVCDWWTIISSKFGTRVDGSAAWLALGHGGAVQNVQSVLPLSDKHPGLMALNTDAQEVMKRPQVHSKLSLEDSDNASQQISGGSSEHNVVNIKEQVSHIRTSGEDE